MENHKITIKNLGPIKELIDFEIKKFNLLIGKSAAGKSVLARAIFLFNGNFSGFGFMNATLHHLLHLKQTRSILAEFLQKFFPQYLAYKIQYNYTEDCFIVAERNGDKISIKFSPGLIKREKQTKEDFRVMLANLTEEERGFFTNYKGDKSPRKTLPDKEMRKISKSIIAPLSRIALSLIDDLGLCYGIFIPATRSVVCDFDLKLQTKIRSRHEAFKHKANWNLLNRISEKLFNKPMLEDAREDNWKALDELSEDDFTLALFSRDNQDSISRFQELFEEYGEIAKGRVRKQKEQIVLTTPEGGQTLTMDQLSSGQKEVITILMLLQYIAEKNIQTFLIVEEPEAHLFPADQAALLNKIAEVAKKTNSKIFITTHSPFLLMAANNLIVAEEKNYKKLQHSFLPYGDVQACKMESGKCESIKNERTGLISVRYIDSVTDEIMREFDDIIGSKP